MDKALLVLACAVFCRVRSSENGSEVFSTTNRTPKMIRDENSDVIEDLFRKEMFRYPVAVVVDKSAHNLNHVKKLWQKYEDRSFRDRKVILFVYDVSGIRQITSFEKTAEFLKAVQKIQPSYDLNASVEKEDKMTPSMQTVVDSLQTIPRDSAVVLFTADKESDRDVAALLTEALIWKRCRLYVIWSGEKDTTDSLDLKEISERVGGRFVYGSDFERENHERKKRNAATQEHTEVLLESHKIESRLFKAEFQVNETFTGIHISIHGKVTLAKLTDPKGITTNLKITNDRHVDYKTDAIVPGKWYLETDRGDESDESYEINILATVPLPIKENADRGKSQDEKMARLRFPDDYDQNGRNETDLSKNDPNPSKNSLQITKTGAGIAQQKTTLATVPIIVEVSSSSSLETRPGSPLQVQFDVKNNLNLPVALSISAQASNIVITNIQPPQTYLREAEAIVVYVTVIFPANAQNAVGQVTLLVQGAGKLTARSAMVYSSISSVSDTWRPKVNYRYLGNCRNYDQPKTCSNGQWSFEATLRDEDSGLLKVLSEPYGLIFRSEFVAGTKSPVTVSYTTSCCVPKVELWAEDLRGNYVKKSLDVFHQGLLEGEIAAIVVGILLLIALVAIIVAVVVICRKRNRMELPRHGGR